MKSANVNGPIKILILTIPIGTFVPNFIALSISSTVPIPSNNAYIASLIYGIKTRFAMNPGISYATTVSFFIYLAILDDIYIYTLMFYLMFLVMFINL